MDIDFDVGFDSNPQEEIIEEYLANGEDVNIEGAIGYDD